MFALAVTNTASVSNGERSAGRRFDREHGVTTQAILFLDDLDPEFVGDAHAHATHYEAIPVADFHALASALPGEVVRASTFIDVGAGMGRALLLASISPFKQIVGIEVSPGLHQIAKENLSRAHGITQRCRDLRVVRADARLWNYPPGDLVVFLYNPFDEIALAQCIGAIVHSRAKDDRVHLIYHTPVHEEALRPFGCEELARHPFGAVFRLRGAGES